MLARFTAYIPAMPELDPITRAKLKLYVAVNNLHLTPPEVPESLKRYCRPLAFYNVGSPFELSFSGTCLLVRHRGHNLLLCTRHQLVNAKRRPDEVVIIVEKIDGGSVGINPNQVSQVVLDPSMDLSFEHLADIMLAEYISNPQGRDLAPFFLPLDLMAIRDLRSVPSETFMAIFSIAYPTSDTDYDPKMDADGNLSGLDIVSRWNKLYLKCTEPNEWDRKGLVPLVPACDDDPVLSDPDGISGAPVFFIHRPPRGDAALGFAGIISHANKRGRVNMIEATHIRQAVEKHLD
ncbi:hypothetical protein D2V07_18175 [Aurantiacibacter zhengii]|uniref:Serine protease n=2 Tax=Aurantiacibacter zhengii TaxID=2307003 RepID=A0A418NN04_9SPHN|nr:hypothetical protein D2V07_18175 [Aurantiacibacter zhengii]